MLLEVYYTDIKYDFTFETSQKILSKLFKHTYAHTLFCGAILYTHFNMIMGVVYNDVFYSFFLSEPDSPTKIMREKFQHHLWYYYMDNMKTVTAGEWCGLIEHISKIQNSVIYRVNKELKSYA